MSTNHDISERVAKRLFGQRKPGDIPYILCRRNEPTELTYELHDTTWEGLRPTSVSGRPGFEIDHNYVLRVGMDGYCMIPETKNNLTRLKNIGVTKKHKVKVRKMNFTTMTEEETEVEEIVRPQYERVEENLVEDNIVDRIAEKLLGSLDENALAILLQNLKDKRIQTGEIVPAKDAPATARPSTNVQRTAERVPVGPAPQASEPPAAVSTTGQVKGARRTGGRPRSQVAPATAT
jgi:hypothetical protein